MNDQEKNLIESAADLENIRRIMDHTVETDEDYAAMAELVDDESVDTEG